jgi:hypothetical protein
LLWADFLLILIMYTVDFFNNGPKLVTPFALLNNMWTSRRAAFYQFRLLWNVIIGCAATRLSSANLGDKQLAFPAVKAP